MVTRLSHRKELFFTVDVRTRFIFDYSYKVFHHSINLLPCRIVPCHAGAADEKRSSFIGRFVHRRVLWDGAEEWDAGIKGALLRKEKGHRDHDNCAGNKQRSTRWEYIPPLRQ